MATSRGSEFTRRTRVVRTLVERAPRWVLVVVGLAAVGLGGLLLVRPLTSLAVLALYVGISMVVTGVADLLAATRPLRSVVAGLWILGGVVVALAQGISLGVLAWGVAILLAGSGVARCVAAIRTRGGRTGGSRTGGDRTSAGRAQGWRADIILGVAEIALAIPTVQWPDVTLLVVAILFGLRTLGFGLLTLWRAVHPVSDGAPPRRGPLRTVAAAVALALVAVLGVVSWQIRASVPTVTNFYVPPADVPEQAGQLIRSEPFTRGVPAQAEAWRILYTTTTDDGTPAVASGLVVVPRARTGEPLPVISWAHGTTGFATHCAPSVVNEPFESGAMMVLDQVLDAGWALVATDYAGLGTDGVQPYVIGAGQAHSVLDATRAAQQMTDLALANDTVIWGHSQGGHGALWSGQLASSYAPDLTVLGTVALAPASDPLGLTGQLGEITGGSVFGSFVIEAYAGTYDDVSLNDYVIPAARTLVRQMATRCLSEPGALVSVLNALSISGDRPIFARDPATGPLGERLAANVATGPYDAPLFIGQGLTDQIVLPTLQETYVARLCAAGVEVESHTYEGLDHLALVAPESPAIADVLSWTRARFAGDATATSHC